MKRLFSIAFMLAVVLVASAQPDNFLKTVQGIEYYFTPIDDSSVTISFPKPIQQQNNIPFQILSLPEEVQRDGNHYRVVKIADSAFYGCSFLRSIVIPRSINSIGLEAFGECKSLRKVTLCCDSLDMSLEAFSRCLLDTIVIGPSVRHLPHFLFSDQKALKYVDFCARHVERMSSLFFECRSETVLHVASDVETIPNNIFFNFV